MRLTRKTILVLALVSAAAAFSLLYVGYAASYSSVMGTNIRLVQAIRVYLGGVSPNRNVTYFIEVQVSSNPGWLGTRIIRPDFATTLDAVNLGSMTLSTSTLWPHSYVTYNLRYSLNESVNPVALDFSGNFVAIKMTGLVISGLYEQSITRGDGSTWNWTTITCVVLCHT